MRVGVVLAASLLAWSPAVSAQDDLVVHSYPYSAAEIDALYETRPEASRIDPALMPKVTVEDGAQLEIRASQSQVAAVWVNAAWQGSIAGCGSRLSYSADSTAITQRADGAYDVAMEGFWVWDVTSRLEGLTTGICTERVQDMTEFTATIAVSLESGSPVVTASAGLAVPERATTTPADHSTPDIAPVEPADESDGDIGGQVIPGVDAAAPPSEDDSDAGATVSSGTIRGDSGETANAASPAADNAQEQGGSVRTPVLVVLTIALLLVALLLLKNTLFSQEATPADEVAEVTLQLLTDPKLIVESADRVVQEDDDMRATAAAQAAGPQFEPTGTATGRATVSGPAEAMSPSGAKLTVPAGSYPSGVTTDWHGQRWTPIKVGDNWWWAPHYKLNVTDEGVGIPSGSPDGHHVPIVLHPLPYSRFELSEPLVWHEQAPSGQVTRHRLDTGKYKLGEAMPHKGGTTYSVYKRDGKEWKFCAFVDESLLPPP